MFLWSLGLLALLKAAVFRSSYRFDGIEGFVEHALLVIGASVLVVLTFLRLRSAGRPNPLAHITRSGRLYPR